MVIRAQRFAIKAPLRYRKAGETLWSEGKIENISRSGMLFRGHGALPLETRVHISFLLPVGWAAEGGAQVTCECIIVRLASPTEGPGFAATICGYEIARQPAPPGDGDHLSLNSRGPTASSDR